MGQVNVGDVGRAREDVGRGDRLLFRPEVNDRSKPEVYQAALGPLRQSVQPVRAEQGAPARRPFGSGVPFHVPQIVRAGQGPMAERLKSPFRIVPGV